MSEFKLTFGDASNNQSISFSEMSTGWNKDKFNGKIQQSIFNLFDCKNVNGEIDIGEEKYNMFKELKAAAGADGNVENLSEEEALAFLQQHGIEDATAEDLFDFFNIAMERPTEQKPEEEPIQEQPLQGQEPPASQDTKETHNCFEYLLNPNLGIINRNQQNKFFMESLQYPQYKVNTDIPEGNDKTALYSHSINHENKGNSYSLHEAQKLLIPQGTNSLSVGAYTQYSREGLFSGVSAAGQVGIGNNNRFSGAGSFTKQIGENSSSMVNVQVTDEQHLGFGGVLSVSGNYGNYQDGQVSIAKEGATVSFVVFIPGKEDTILHGGKVFVDGEVMHSETTVNDASNTQGNTTLVKGDLGAIYELGIPYVGDINLMAAVSAFDMIDTDEGTKIAGGVNGPFGLKAEFGSIPGNAGWEWAGISKSIQLYPLTIGAKSKNDVAEINKNAPVVVTTSATYLDNNLFGLMNLIGLTDSSSQEHYVYGGVNVHINSINADAGGQYTLQQVAGNSSVHDVNLYYSQYLIIGNNMQCNVTLESGCNTQIGPYVCLGGGVNIK